MGIRIHQLSPLIANQIAAGEVIERPASVVKELLENSLDAGADAITIEIGYGGLNQIKISDNGSGIVAEDLPLAIAAHATSKITALNDLYAIGSMGFRGEALASIASIAKVTISSKPQQQDTAMMLQVQGNTVSQAPCARAPGTTIDVVDLFFNAPVRKRFLKSEKLEFQAIESVVKRFALSAPHVALTLKHNNKQILLLPAATTEHALLTRLTRILGNPFVKDAIYLDVERGAMRLHGWISGVNFQRSQNDRQWIYINQRMVKDKLIYHAIKQAYDGHLHPGRFPSCVLYLSIDAAEVDVNVHPTKHEVRFQQPRLVHDFFTSQITAALQAAAAVTYKEYELSSDVVEKVHEICEPSPVLLAQQHSLGARHDFSWTALTQTHVLMLIEQHAFLVDVYALHKYALYEELTQHTLPLASRPLLVPIRYTLSTLLKNKCVALHAQLMQLGIQLEFIAEHEVMVKSIPLCVPYLNLPAFFDALEHLEAFQLASLLDVISECQSFDPKLLSNDEKMTLYQLMEHLQQQDMQKHGLYKALTLEACRNLLYV